jgi:hypothetical protein
MHAGIP